jgi:molybdenum cofactor cytidylyltransferase
LIFGRVPLANAVGAVLAHTTRLPGATLPKGRVLSAEAVEKLRAAGHDHIIGAILEPGDVPEDEAARRLANAILAPGITRTRASTGRANLTATHAGLFRADVGAINAINRVHEGLTVATLADTSPVGPGTLLATVKIIPFAVPETILLEAESHARAAPPLRLPPFRPLRAGLVLTELPGLSRKTDAATVQATERRVRALSGTLMTPMIVPHTEAALAAALRALHDAGAELLLVAAASATVDRGDVGPVAIVAAGGAADYFGMPVDPGNLICLGHIGATPCVILPGCARSPSRNGIDLVLARIFAGEPTAPADIAQMGVGGLLKEAAARPAPRLRAAPPRRIAAIVLAAGLSSRMAPHNKLLLPDASGTPMIARTVDAILASRARPVCVAVGHQADAVTKAISGRPVTIVPVPDYQAGLAASLRAALAGLPPDIAAALICLGDMPLVSAADIDRLLDAYNPAEGSRIVVPIHNGIRGNPVLWDRSYFAAMMALTGDRGARRLLHDHAATIVELPMPTDAVLRDFDTPEAVTGLTEAGPGAEGV